MGLIMFRVPKTVKDLFLKAKESRQRVALLRYPTNNNEHIRLHGHIEHSVAKALAKDASAVRFRFVHKDEHILKHLDKPEITREEEQILCLFREDYLKKFDVDSTTLEEQIADLRSDQAGLMVTPISFQNYYMLSSSETPILLAAPNPDGLAWMRHLVEVGLKTKPMFKYELEALEQVELMRDVAKDIGNMGPEQERALKGLEDDVRRKMGKKLK
ncbi:MAG: hypothetical protein CMF48_07805 [Legionellales bacterium]|nr:hypothetical protein [Legionellales bacterium]|tara:strand:+ start:269 stop:913 length:645 start_codon:yes stop_codon:yes gene_type:complete